MSKLKKLCEQPLLSPEGMNIIAVGNAHGPQARVEADPEGVASAASMRPLQGRIIDRRSSGGGVLAHLPPAIISVPYRDRSVPHDISLQTASNTVTIYH